MQVKGVELVLDASLSDIIPIVRTRHTSRKEQLPVHRKPLYSRRRASSTRLVARPSFLTVPVVVLISCVTPSLAVIQMVVVGFDEAFPLWLLSKPDVGGLGWDPKRIGEVMEMGLSTSYDLKRRNITHAKV